VAVMFGEDGWVGQIQLGRWASYVRERRRFFTILVIVVSVLTCFGLALLAGWHATAGRLDRLAWEFVPLMVLAHLAAYVGYLIAHHQVFNRSREHRVGWRLSAQIAVIGFGGWLIGGGFTVDRRAHITAGFTSSDAGNAVITLAAIELLVLTPAAWFCAVLANHSHGVSPSATIPWIIAVPAGFGVVAGLLLLRYLQRNRPPRLVRLRALEDGLEATIELLADPGRGPAAVAGIAAYWAADFLALWAALRFASISIALPRLVVGYATAYFLTRRTLPFAGALIIEALLAVSLVWVGVPLAAAALAVLVYRLSDFALTLSGALAVSSVLEGSLTFLPFDSET
jgi:uncharacterized membrane protein YbhN (UPF0104 family)